MPTAEPPGTPLRSSRPPSEKPTPTHAAAGTRVRQRAQREERRKDDVEPGDEAGAGDRRQLEAGRLQPVGEREQDADAAAREHSVPGQLSSGRQANGASTAVEIAKRTARKAKSG